MKENLRLYHIYTNKNVDCLVDKCDRVLEYDYIRINKKVVRCIHLTLCNNYGINKSWKLRTHLMIKVIDNENAEL